MTLSASFVRWWGNRSLTGRLLFVFTALFGFTVLVLSLFLGNIIHMIDLNNRARLAFENNRRVSQLRDRLLQYELAVNQYEINASFQAQIELVALGQLIDENIIELSPMLTGLDAASLNQVAAGKQQLTRLADEVVKAVDQKDWPKLKSVDDQLYNALGPVLTVMDSLVDRQIEGLDRIQVEADLFSWVIYIAGALALPVFVLLALAAALIIYRQIDLPFEVLASAATDLLNGKPCPAEVPQLSQRSDEIGMLSAEFVTMAAAIASRDDELSREADEIRGKIR